jgi:hypothetical protein
MKTFLVTGSDRGIGEALCREIHARGERVLAACLDDSEKLRADGVRVEPAIDVTSDRAAILSADATVRLAPWNRWDRALRRSPPVVFTSPQWAASPDSSFPTSCCTFASRFTASSATRSFPSTHGSIPTRPIFLKKTTAVSRRKRRPPVSGVSARRKNTAEGASMLDCIGGAAAPRAPCCVPASREAIAAPRSRDHAELSTRQSPRPSPVEACKPWIAARATPSASTVAMCLSSSPTWNAAWKSCAIGPIWRAEARVLRVASSGFASLRVGPDDRRFSKSSDQSAKSFCNPHPKLIARLLNPTV